MSQITLGSILEGCGSMRPGGYRALPSAFPFPLPLPLLPLLCSIPFVVFVSWNLHRKLGVGKGFERFPLSFPSGPLSHLILDFPRCKPAPRPSLASSSASANSFYLATRSLGLDRLGGRPLRHLRPCNHPDLAICSSGPVKRHLVQISISKVLSLREGSV